MQPKIEFHKTHIEGVLVVERLSHIDDRGVFTNFFNKLHKSEIWESRLIKQVNISTTEKVGTIRGMHLQVQQFAEAKLITCLNGAIYDVVVDLRKNSRTFGSWFGLELSSYCNNSIFLPEGIAHGFQVLETNSQVLYCHSSDYNDAYQSGINPFDETLMIDWPLNCSLLSDRDKTLPSLENFRKIYDGM